MGELFVTNKQTYVALLERHISRLQRRIDILDRRSTRYSWIRVAIFFGGLFLTPLAWILFSWLPGVMLLVLTIVAFGIAAYYHSRIEHGLTRHTLWLQIKSDHIARMRLDWSHIPSAGDLSIAGSSRDEHPFENDLDITGRYSLHRLLNVAISREGASRLREWLLCTRPDMETLRRKQALVRELTPLTFFRDKLTMNSLLAGRDREQYLDGQRLLHWLGQRQPASGLLPLLLLLTALHVMTVVLFVLNIVGLLAPLWIVPLVSAVVLFLATGEQRGDIFDEAVFLRYSFSTLSSIFSFLEEYPYKQHVLLKQLCEPFYREPDHGPTNLLRNTARVADAATLKQNAMIWIAVNALVPWDIYCAYRLRQYKDEVATRLPQWLDTWYELEALCSLANFAHLNPEYTMPDVIDEPGAPVPLLSARELGHPLIPVEKKICNDFMLDEKGEVIIITGSNMAGKSTFLRTLGVNLCLAYAGGPVNAAVLRTRPFRLFSCIRISDSVTEGYSYFYSEVRRLRALLRELEQPGYPLLFLIDEIFKGTNNRERLIGSRSFVRALIGRNCLGIISTHDLELVKLADVLPQVKNFHFREEVVEGRMVFDYKLRPGPCPTTNALKIMQMEGLPIEKDA
jgi:ABC-type multidrug transport system fused ATPase/permease subunit